MQIIDNEQLNRIYKVIELDYFTLKDVLLWVNSENWTGSWGICSGLLVKTRKNSEKYKYGTVVVEIFKYILSDYWSKSSGDTDRFKKK